MKKITAIFLAVALCVGCSGGAFAAQNNDSIATLVVEKSPADELREMGILKGDPDGSLRLGDTITRAEAAALLVRIEKTDIDCSSIFEDMRGHWAEKEVSMAYETGLVEGTGEQAFSPDEKVTVQEFVKMVITLLGYKDVAESRGGYPVGYLSHANQLGVFHGLKFITTEEINRGDVAAILVNCLDIPIMQQSSISFGNDKAEYIIADGKDGREYITLRTIFEGNQN